MISIPFEEFEQSTAGSACSLLKQSTQIPEPAVFKWRKRYPQAGLEGFNDPASKWPTSQAQHSKDEESSYADHPARVA